MRSVGIEALGKDLGEYVRAAEAGETVVVTDSGRVVAELIPPRGNSEQAEGEVLDRGLREGWLSPAEVDWRQPLHDAGPPPNDDPAVAFDTLMAELDRDREDR